MDPDYESMCIEVVKRAQSELKKAVSIYNANRLLTEKKGHGNWVTHGDRVIEADLYNWVCRSYPEHGVVAEETFTDHKEREFIWYIDPIDGTTNYIRSNNSFSVSIGLMRGEKPLIGVVCGRYELYAAAAGQAVCLDMAHQEAYTLDNALIGFSPKTAQWLYGRGGNPLGLMTAAGGYRYIGSSALELCRVASGKLDLYFSSSLKPWDYAAAKAVLAAAEVHMATISVPETLVVAWRQNDVLRQALRYFPGDLRFMVQTAMED